MTTTEDPTITAEAATADPVQDLEKMVTAARAALTALALVLGGPDEPDLADVDEFTFLVCELQNCLIFAADRVKAGDGFNDGDPRDHAQECVLGGFGFSTDCCSECGGWYRTVLHEAALAEHAQRGL